MEHLLFLQNLLVYKTLKSNLKQTRMNQKGSLDLYFLRSCPKVLLGSWFSNLRSLSVDLKSINSLESRLTCFYGLEVNLMPFKLANDWQHAHYLADEIVFFLQKRIPFRRLKNKLLKEVSRIPHIRGVRITCSGRVGGKSKKAQRAKTECLKYGQTSLQVFSSKIDFSIKTALTSFGSVGVKVWICYN